MKIFLTVLVFSISGLVASAQQDRFIYLQTENTQPFFVKLNNKIFNSFPQGYLIIPKLDDGVYSLVIRFPDSNREQAFNCSIDQKDVGFIIKNAGEQQWQLLNVQSGKTVIPAEVIAKTTGVYETQTDPFSIMLANAVHDSTILRIDVAMETDNPVEIKDSIAPAKGDSTSLAFNNVNTSRPDSVAINLQDSSAKDLAKINPVKENDGIQKDSLQLTSPALVVNPDNKVTDPAKTDVTISLKDSLIKGNDSTIVTSVIPKDSSIITSTDVKINPDSTANSGVVKTDTQNEVIEESRTPLADSAKTNVVKNDVAVSKTDKKKKVTKNDKKVTEPVVATTRSIIKRKSRRNGKEGMELVYVDDNGETKDTIRIVIPVEQKIKEDAKITDVVVTIPQDDKGKETAGKNKYKVTKEEKEIIKEANKETSLPSTMINSDCKNLASEDDFLKMRKKMVAENNDADMIKAAKKIFKTRCFSTEQIKNLSVLFLKDETRFMFFEVAYPYASDSDLYFALEKQLSDENYITRFRAMIHK